MSIDYKDLIADLHLEQIEEDKSKSKSMSKFNMDGNSPKREHKKQKHPHIGSDNRGKWQRTPEYIEKKSLQMRELWQDTSFKEYMRQQQKGVPHVFTHGWSEESRRRYSEKLKNTIWINDGNNNKRHSNDQPIPKGWVKGQIRKRSAI